MCGRADEDVSEDDGKIITMNIAFYICVCYNRPCNEVKGSIRPQKQPPSESRTL